MKIFISRNIDPGGPLDVLKRDNKIVLDGQSLLDLSSILLSEIPKEEFLFFSSKNGVKFFFDQASVAVSKRYGAIGPSTAEEMTKYGVIPEFIGEGQSDTVAEQLAKHIHKNSVCFISGRNYSSTIEDYLVSNHISTNRYFVYDQIPTYPVMHTLYDLYIFTSPLNWTSFHKKNAILPDSEVWAIGDTTLSAIKKDLPNQHIFIPDNPTEKEICLALEQWM